MGAFVLRFPLRIFNKLTPTIAAFVVLFATASGAIFGDLMGSTGGAEEFYHHGERLPIVGNNVSSG